jgi:hypothetical protein
MQPKSSVFVARSLWNPNLGLVVGMAILLNGCAAPTPVTPVSAHPTVMINVYPSGSSTPNGWTCTNKGTFVICVSEDPINLTGDSDPVTVQWTLAPGWKFSKNKGIEVNGGGWHEHEVDDQHYTAWNKKDKRIYKYKISIVNEGTTLEWDPFIWND